VRNKLYELGANTTEVNELLAELIEKGLLNEEQYARAIARGKFRMKQWGRRKIVQQLKLKQVSEYCIKKALTEIDAEEYEGVLQKLTRQKWDELKKERSMPAKKMKTMRYMLQKGYESDLVLDIIKELERERK
jgi:regulatory protein